MCRRRGWLGCDARGTGCAAKQSHQPRAERLPREPNPQPRRSRGRTVFTAEVRQTAEQGSNFVLLLLKSFPLRFLCLPLGEGDEEQRGAASWVLVLPLGLGLRAAKHQAGTAATRASPCTIREQPASHPRASRNKSPPPTSPPRIGLGTRPADTHEPCLSPQVWQQAQLRAPLPLAVSLNCKAPRPKRVWRAWELVRSAFLSVPGSRLTSVAFGPLWFPSDSSFTFLPLEANPRGGRSARVQALCNIWHGGDSVTGENSKRAQ